MADANKLASAKTVYKTLCEALDDNTWHYKSDDEKLAVSFDVNGDDIPMNFFIVVDAERQLVYIRSTMPFKFPEDKRMDGAIATCAATYQCSDGSFDYDVSDGTVSFRLTASFRGSVFGKDLFHYLFACGCSTVDEYNDKFLALSKGVLSIEDFLKKA